jgi:hypothetical protein
MQNGSGIEGGKGKGERRGRGGPFGHRKWNEGGRFFARKREDWSARGWSGVRLPPGRGGE